MALSRFMLRIYMGWFCSSAVVRMRVLKPLLAAEVDGLVANMS